MQFFPKHQKVEAQQFTDPNHLEWVTLVRIERTDNNSFRYYAPGYVSSYGILISDWVVLYENGIHEILSSEEFEYRFQREDEVASLKATIDYLSKKFQELR